MQYTDEELVFAVNGLQWPALVRTPERVTPGGVLCINQVMARGFTLNTYPYTIVSDIFLAAGHRVASLEMPNHGQLIDHYGESLTGMAAATAAGVDVFANLRLAGRLLIDECVQRCWASPGRIVTTGTSRGGHAALHLMAGDARVLAAAPVAPMTYLPALVEFAKLAENEIVKRGNAGALAPQLSDRPVFIVMGEEDPRVGAQHAFDLFARLQAASHQVQPLLYTLPEASHGPAFLEPGYHAAAAFLLTLCANAIKGAVRDIAY